MRKLIPFLLLAVSISCVAQNPPGAPAPLSPEKKVELYKARESINAIINKIQSSPDWVEYQKLQEDARKESDAVMKGVDTKKWGLDKDFNWVAVDAPKVEPPVQSKQEKK